jgi:exodeoxyribonuclease-3
MVKIFSWNVNGIRAVIKKNALQPLLNEHQPDILCMQEVKATEEQASIELNGYRAIWYAAQKPGYSGTAILTKIEPLQIVTGFPADIIEQYGVTGDTYGNPNLEGRVIAAEFENYWLVTVYTPNVKDDLTRLDLRSQHWDTAFLTYMQRLEESKPVVFCGDLNVAHTEEDLANPKTNRGKRGFTDEERTGFQAFVDAGFVDTLRIFKQGNGLYTWWSYFANSRARNVGWRIDYFLVSSTLKDKVMSADIYPKVMGSDHCPVSIELDV